MIYLANNSYELFVYFYYHEYKMKNNNV